LPRAQILEEITKSVTKTTAEVLDLHQQKELTNWK